MIFGETKPKNEEKCFSPSDLFQYVDTLIREAKYQERKLDTSNYSWLRSKNIQNAILVDNDLEILWPSISKMTPQSCASIAVKIDKFTEQPNVTTDAILTAVKNLLEEQGSIQEMEARVRRVKKKIRVNRVSPELLQGRQPTVSFIVESEVTMCYF